MLITYLLANMGIDDIFWFRREVVKREIGNREYEKRERCEK
jgi:hypothetical protein